MLLYSRPKRCLPLHQPEQCIQGSPACHHRCSQVPPEVDRLKRGIKSGGGIIEKIHQEWHIY